jgi:membrane protein implicated in regulation of membrane protease activity
MLKNAKLILVAVAILVAVFAVIAVIGFVVWLAKILFFVALVVFAVAVYKKLAGKSEPRRLQENDDDRELNEALRQLEEIKRRQLVK